MFFGYYFCLHFIFLNSVSKLRNMNQQLELILYLTCSIYPIHLSCTSIAYHSTDSETRASPQFCPHVQIEYLANYQHCIRGSTALQWRNLMQTESQLINSEITGSCLPKCPYGKGISNPLAEKGSGAPCEFPHLFSYSKSGSIKQIKQCECAWACMCVCMCAQMHVYVFASIL